MYRVLNCLGTQHDLRLVVLAGIVCILASIAAVKMFHSARALHGVSRATWLLTAGAAGGSGVWATHFIAMLAFDPGFPIAFELTLTIVSLLVAIVVTTLGLVMAVYGTIRFSALAGGAVFGAGIACMHYLGMAAVEFPGYIVWSTDLIVASILLGVVFGAAGFDIAARGETSSMALSAAGLIAFATLAHHFTAMGAAGVIPGFATVEDPNALSAAAMSVAIATVAACVLGLCLVGTWTDRRARKQTQDQNRRLDGALNNMNKGLCMFDADDRLMVWNGFYVNMYGIAPDGIWQGCAIRDLLNARIAAGTFPLNSTHYESELRTAITQGKSYAANLELNDGRIIAVVTQPMKGGGWVATHEDITERKRAERDLDQTRAFLDTIIENVPSPIVVKDTTNFKFLLINRAAEKYFGVDRATMLGKTAADILPKANADRIAAEDAKLIETAQTIQLGEQTIVTPGNGTRIVTSTRLAVSDAAGKPQYLISLIHDITDQKRSEQRIAHLAHHDSLTDLPNRAAFNECIAATLDLASASGESFAVLCVDLDRFKAVNDVFGHHVGDALLREVAHRMETVCQGAFISRVGGDEFTVITPTGPQPATAEALAARIGEAFAGDIEIGGHATRVGLTIGVGVYPQDGANAETLVANADAALFRAKSEARGSIRFFEMSMDKQLREKRALQQDLRSAVTRNELTLHYQPQAQIDGTITGFEALARWHHPRRGLVPPNVFIPLAEESGVIVALGEWVLRTACSEAASWPNPLQVAVNLSPLQFQHGDLAGLVHRILLETGLPPPLLEIEITEGVLIGDFNRAVSTLRKLKNLGVRIAMDDFGTGYSSLSYLQSFPFDKIKIDQAFIANLGHSQQAATIIRAVIALSHGLELPVVAEGVETKEQLKFLADEKCDSIQGYLIGRPKPIADYAKAVGRKPPPRKRLALVANG